MKGDLNKDNKIDLVDVNYLLRYISNDSNYPIENIENADINLDGKITLADVNYLLKYISNDPNYPIKESLYDDLEHDINVPWAGDAKSKDWWKKQRGIGFSVGGGSFIDEYKTDESDGRLLNALYRALELGFTVLRTWGFSEFEIKMLEMIRANNMPFFVQIGIYNTRANQDNELNYNAMKDILKFKDIVCGVSVGNEMLASWMPGRMEVETVLKHIKYMHQFNIPVTYNLAEGTAQAYNLDELFKEVDYINIHDYGGWHLSSGKTVEDHINTIINSQRIFYDLVPDEYKYKPIIFGEIGRQVNNKTYATIENLEKFFIRVNELVYNENLLDGMIYFNFTDESWKGNDDNWGLHYEGDKFSIGQEKFDIESAMRQFNNN